MQREINNVRKTMRKSWEMQKGKEKNREKDR